MLSLTDILMMMMMTTATVWHWYLQQKCLLYEHDDKLYCRSEEWWAEKFDQQYDTPTTEDTMTSGMATTMLMSSRGWLSNKGIWLLARRILHLRIGLLKPFLVGAKKTRLGLCYHIYCSWVTMMQHLDFLFSSEPDLLMGIQHGSFL